MTAPDEQAPVPHADPQTHIDTDPVNNPETDLAGNPRPPADTESRAGSETDRDQHAEGGDTPSASATDA